MATILENLQQQADEQGQINWDIHHVDGMLSVLTNMQQGQKAIGAVMHKLLRILYGVLKSQQPFDPNRLCPP